MALTGWPGSGRREPASGWAGHERRAGDLVTEFQSLAREGVIDARPGNQVVEDWITRVRQLSPEALTSLLLLLTRQAVAIGLHTAWALGKVDLRKCAVTDDDAVCALRVAEGLGDGYMAGTVLVKALAMAAQARPGTSADLRSAIEAVARSVNERTQLAVPDRARLRRELLVLMPSGGQPDEAIDTSLIAPRDGWAAAVLPELADWQGISGASTRSVNSMLHELATAPGSKPSKAWLARAGELARDAPAARVVRLLLETLTTAHGAARKYYGMTDNVLLSGENADIARSAAWAASLLDEPWVVPTLRAVAYQGIHTTGQVDYVASPKLANACIYSLGMIASADAIAALQDLQRTTRHNGFRKQISAAL